MKKGLVLGKFMPLHKGHLALINFAEKNCDQLNVLLCCTSSDPISAKKRMDWLKESFNKPTINIHVYNYDEKHLSNTSVYSPDVAKAWANVLKQLFPDIMVFFTSEEYGEPVANHLGIQHLIFDLERKQIPIAASHIRENPFKYWDYLPAHVQPYFVKKIGISGTESTGKSTLAKDLASYFKTSYVAEMAREVIGHTNQCTFSDLYKIAELHAKTIREKVRISNKILLIDTDLNTTKAYANYLFKQNLFVPEWIEEANKFDLHILLETDCPFVQDGTRLNEKERNELQVFHKKQMKKSEINYTLIGGTWEERLSKSISLIDKSFPELCTKS